MDREARTYDALVSVVYDCAVDPALWPHALGMIAQTYSGAYVGLYVTRMRPACEVMGLYHSWHDDAIIRRIEEYVFDIPGFDKLADAPLDH
jgi:hypothetical protein